jgi:hypothetical protein
MIFSSAFILCILPLCPRKEALELPLKSLFRKILGKTPFFLWAKTSKRKVRLRLKKHPLFNIIEGPEKPMELKLDLNAKKILDQKFTKDVKGYNPKKSTPSWIGSSKTIWRSASTRSNQVLMSKALKTRSPLSKTRSSPALKSETEPSMRRRSWSSRMLPSRTNLAGLNPRINRPPRTSNTSPESISSKTSSTESVTILVL